MESALIKPYAKVAQFFVYDTSTNQVIRGKCIGELVLFQADKFEDICGSHVLSTEANNALNMMLVQLRSIYGQVMIEYCNKAM